MYLKNLTALGFKSFADKTSLTFQPGITAIVGPNGCGKSNVADAIRWVLGEQSAKALRGGEMADVIFNGTDSRKAMGMSEVSLTIGDVDEEHLRAAGVDMEFNEVTLTRRVFRDGGSEYFLNKTACRLKDIQQLFMGTGVGRTSYSIMAQGNITQILSSKPEERRLVFEEAAGITKFKAQKREALRKLDHTEQNLLRVTDLIREVKRQIGSLQRQAGKARRFQQISEELRHLETQLARHQFDVLDTEIRDREARAEILNGELTAISEDVDRHEDEIQQLRDLVADLEQRIHVLREKGMELKGESDRHESRIQFGEERLVELKNQHERALSDISQGEERRGLSETELSGLRVRLAESEESLAVKQRMRDEKRVVVDQIESDLRQCQENLRNAQASAFEQVQKLAKLRNEINGLDLRKEGNAVRLEKLSTEKVQLEEERSRLEARLAEFLRSVESAQEDAETHRGTVEERQKRLREIQEELVERTRELDRLLQRQTEARSRLNVLEQLESSHEGFSEGALAALKKSESVLGSLADRIRVPDEHVTAVEAALGTSLQLLFTRAPAEAEAILGDLALNRKGRASVAAMEWIESLVESAGSAGRQNPEDDDAAAKIGIRLCDVIDCDPPVKPLLDALFGRIRIVSDLDAAKAAWQSTRGRFDFVTGSGELLNRFGVFTGGAGNGSSKAASSILGRKNQIAELEKTGIEFDREIAGASDRRKMLQDEQQQIQQGLQEALSALRNKEVSIATHQGELNALQNGQRSLNDKFENVLFEIESLTAQEEEGREKRETLLNDVREAERNDEASRSDVAERAAALEDFRHKREEASAALTEAKVAVATEEQLCAAFQRQIAPLEQRIAEIDQLVEQRRGEISAHLERKSQFEADIAESRQQIQRIQHEREQVNRETADLVGQKETQQTDVDARETRLKQQRSRQAQLQDERGRIDVELARKRMSVENLRDRIQSKYQVNLEDIRSECITITYADEGGPARVETVSPEDMAVSGAATDWDAVAEQVDNLQQRVDDMGPVNLVAIEEYEETEQRYEFLNKQNNDLVEAKEQLLEVLSRINVQTREMFTGTFKQIRENFQKMFVEIFGGGKADLILTDEQNVLESGIDIVARPPGKKLQSISLLSGGEQTMTAVSLLFSIYQVRPSPFCVLDELDAPLDESNINRFLRILKRFLDHSQFVIITHNKRTIGMADVLYGVTMQEHGVSKIVGVKFHKQDEPAIESNETNTARPLVPPDRGTNGHDGTNGARSPEPGRVPENHMEEVGAGT